MSFNAHGVTMRLKGRQVEDCSQNVVKKKRLKLYSTAPPKMFPQFYHDILVSQLTVAQYLTLQWLVMLVQTYKNIQIEKLAENLVLPIKYESRQRHRQRWLSLKVLKLTGIWCPIIREMMKRKFSAQSRLELILERC